MSPSATPQTRSWGATEGWALALECRPWEPKLPAGARSWARPTKPPPHGGLSHRSRGTETGAQRLPSAGNSSNSSSSSKRPKSTGCFFSDISTLRAQHLPDQQESWNSHSSSRKRHRHCRLRSWRYHRDSGKEPREQREECWDTGGRPSAPCGFSAFSEVFIYIYIYICLYHVNRTLWIAKVEIRVVFLTIKDS